LCSVFHQNLDSKSDRCELNINWQEIQRFRHSGGDFGYVGTIMTTQRNAVSIMLKVLLVEDDSFTRQLIANALTQQGFEVAECDNASTAIDLLNATEPHVVVSDLDLGRGASGLDLMRLVNKEFPWVGLVALSAHSTSMLVGEGSLPDGTPYLVKSAIKDLSEIGAAIRVSISNLTGADSNQANAGGENAEEHFVSQAQAETLRLLSQGHTNQSIADERGTSLRAAETMIQRTYKSLGLTRETRRNNRVEAVSLWRQGKVRVR
jgi:DNA-binding NarL/FixJ family response regulator